MTVLTDMQAAIAAILASKAAIVADGDVLKRIVHGPSSGAESLVTISNHGSSTTSLAVGTGSKSLTTESGKGWVAGDAIVLTKQTDVTITMTGTVTSYSGTALVVNVTSVTGSGTHAAWYVSGQVKTVARVLIESAAPGRQTVWIPATAINPKLVGGASYEVWEIGTNKVPTPVLVFDAVTQQAAGFYIHMPKSWNEGNFYFDATWTAQGGGSGNIVVALAARAMSNDDPIDAAMGTAKNALDAFIADNDIHITPESAEIVTSGTPLENDIVYFELTRLVDNASDTYASRIGIIGLRLIFTNTTYSDN